MGGSSLSPFNIAISYCAQQNSSASGPVQRFVLIPIWCGAALADLTAGRKQGVRERSVCFLISSRSPKCCCNYRLHALALALCRRHTVPSLHNSSCTLLRLTALLCGCCPPRPCVSMCVSTLLSATCPLVQ
jgi:hypothetical protein